MTFQIFRNRMIVIVFLAMTVCNLHAQQKDMQTLIHQSLEKLQNDSSQTALQCVMELKRIEAIFPDSIAPKYHIALQSLSYAVSHPHDEQTPQLLTMAEQAIKQMEGMRHHDLSDLHALQAFHLTVLVVQNPAQNGPRYYRDVLDLLDKSLKANPENALAKMLRQQFTEGMQRAL